MRELGNQQTHRYAQIIEVYKLHENIENYLDLPITTRSIGSFNSFVAITVLGLPFDAEWVPSGLSEEEFYKLAIEHDPNCFKSEHVRTGSTGEPSTPLFSGAATTSAGAARS